MAKGSPRIPRKSTTRRQRDWISAANFKATCLELMDRVSETRTEYVVTKHGRPVAKLVPYTEPARQPLFGSMKGTVLKYERPFDPIDGDWDINRE
jgi:prevent-host-death family protein